MKLGRIMLAGTAGLALAGCAARTAAPGTAAVAAPVEVKIIGFNDFHGHLAPPRQSIEAPGPDGSTVRVPAGGAAYFASAVAALRRENPNTVVVSAGDMISASPLASSLFLDEPTIHAMNLIGVDFNAAGNHEYDRGAAELKRIQHGGCEKHTRLEPCQVEPFPGARFGILTANTLTADGKPLLGDIGIRRFGSGEGQVTVAFIGMTLDGTPSIVSPSGIAGLSFRDEADTANALIPRLKEQGADAIVVLVHEGAETSGGYNDKRCEGLSGALVGILDRLDPRVDLVVSGHTHKAYVCDYGRINPTRPFLVTSAGQYGTLLTDVTLSIDPVANKVVARRADNRIVQSEGRDPVTDLYPRYAPDPAVAAVVDRYTAAARERSERPVGRIAGTADRERNAAEEMLMGDIIADAQLAAMRPAEAGGAEIAFMNPGGVRASLAPRADGTVTFGDIYAVQPFGNTLMVRRFSGAQLKAILEQQFDPNKAGGRTVLLPSANLRYSYDLNRPVGSRVFDVTIDGRPLDPARTYRVAASNFLMNGGDGFTSFAAGTDPVVGGTDLDALELYIASAPGGVLPLPTLGRIRNATAQ